MSMIGASNNTPVSETKTTANIPTSMSQSYAPFNSISQERTQSQALHVSTMLKQVSTSAAVNLTWNNRFWNYVWSLEDSGKFDLQIENVLTGHEYIGKGTVTAPRTQKLVQTLYRLMQTTGVAHGSMAQSLLAQNTGHKIKEQEAMRWSTALPDDFHRGVPATYKSMRASGPASVRDWLQSNYGDCKRTWQFIGLWTAACQIDFRLAQGGSLTEAIQILASDGGVEMTLGRLAAWVYERRTKDKAGANSMLAIVSPGSNFDVAPLWMISAASTYS
eukprot:TRINITY_DN94662_c0_g1_i1.p1 TRINITY_DN94662_c0_g1~~TRINITY_DN94662_c0_g1_i1.p1  ORF type:complete len:275 (-),score=6.71 TRINITY_DN94662_c0_g1_i1:333-1157(-)